MLISLKTGRDKPVRHRHPWIFSGAIDGVHGQPAPGDIVRVATATGEFLATGYYNSKSQIVIRLLAWSDTESIDDSWWTDKISEAIGRRAILAADQSTDAYRLVYAEADGLPGLIVDRYGDYLVTEFLTAGIERRRATIINALKSQLAPVGIVDRSDPAMRELEGLPDSRGISDGTQPPADVTIREKGIRYVVDLDTGQKTGFYLDQRDNRLRVAAYAHGRAVLDCFSYSGGFALPMLAHGAESVTCIDSSAAAIELLSRNFEMFKNNGAGPTGPLTWIQGSVFEVLRKFRDQQRAFDMIVLDPPKLAGSQSQLKRALRAYKDLNLLAMKLLTPNGILATFSCSGAVSREVFLEMLSWAATDAGRVVQVLEHLCQGEDHPVLLSFPESEYLKGIVCRVQ